MLCGSASSAIGVGNHLGGPVLRDVVMVAILSLSCTGCDVSVSCFFYPVKMDLISDFLVLWRGLSVVLT